MDINLNLSASLMNNFLGNTSESLGSTNKELFEGLFAGLESEEEDSTDIDDNLLLSMLSTLQTFKYQEFQDDIVQIHSEQGNINIVEDNGNTELGGFYELLNSNNENLNSLLDKIVKSNDELNDLVEESISNSEINLTNEEIEILKNLKHDNIADLNTEKNNTSLESNYSSNLKENAKISTEIYKELEISGLGNKNNITHKKESDKDIDTLESILNEDSNYDFTFGNDIGFRNEISNTSESNTQIVTNIRQEYIEEDVVKTVKYLSSNGLEEITIKISPRELGDMTIKLIKTEEETRVNITLSKEDIFELVNKNLDEITQHLDELNISVKDISIDIKTNNQNYFSDNLNHEFDKKNQQNQQRKNKTGKTMVETIEDMEDDKLEEDNLNILI